MIVEKQKNSFILVEGEETNKSIETSLDLDSAYFIMQTLSKNLYSDEIGSTIREWSSNALDSHRVAGTTDPIIVSLKANNEGNYEFTVEDFGVGLDADDVENIISKYGKSTKRESANELGMWGLGFKSGLAYSSTFYFIARKNGIERKYMMYEGEDVNKIDLLYESPTSERNGTKMIIPVKYSDRGEFYDKIKEQLCYFENVFFDVNVAGDVIENNFSIFRTEHFQISELCNDEDLHLCLDDVYYPLDFSKLGIDRINVKMALRFGLSDGVMPVPNRESIRYSTEAKTIILNKIKKLSDYLANKYNETAIETESFVDIYNYYRNEKRIVKINEENTIDVYPFIKYMSIPLNVPTMKGVNLLNLQSLASKQYHDNVLTYEYQIVFELINDRMYKGRYIRAIQLNDDLKYYYYSDKLSGTKKEYIKSLHPNSGWNSSVKIIKKIRSIKLKSTIESKTYFNILNLKSHPKSEWRERIKEFQYIQSTIMKNWINVDEMIVPQSFINRNKITYTSSTGTIIPKVRKTKLSGALSGKMGEDVLRDTGNNCKFTPFELKMEEIHKFPYLIIYGTEGQKEKLDGLYPLTKNRKRKVVILSDREFKKVEKVNIHNLISYDKFMEGDNKPFKRLVTAYLIKKLMDDFQYTFSKKDRLNGISTSLYNSLKLLDEYRKEHYRPGGYYDSEDLIYKSMLSVAEEHNLFDENIISVYRDVKSILEQYYFINPIMEKLSSYNDRDNALMKAMVDLFKYHKYRLDYKNYHQPILDCEQIDENKIEELTTTI